MNRGSSNITNEDLEGRRDKAQRQNKNQHQRSQRRATHMLLLPGHARNPARKKRGCHRLPAAAWLTRGAPWSDPVLCRHPESARPHTRTHRFDGPCRPLTALTVMQFKIRKEIHLYLWLEPPAASPHAGCSSVLAMTISLQTVSRDTDARLMGMFCWYVRQASSKAFVSPVMRSSAQRSI